MRDPFSKPLQASVLDDLDVLAGVGQLIVFQHEAADEELRFDKGFGRGHGNMTISLTPLCSFSA